LIWINAHFPEIGQKVLHLCGVDAAVHELIAHQPVSLWRGGVNRQQERKPVLVDFIHTEDARELVHYQG